MLLFISSLCFLALLLSPDTALAWGPGMHVETALRILDNLPLIAPAIAKLIEKYPNDFIYGSTSPDIIVGKKYAGYHHHCHNWRMGHLILEEANGDRQKAAAFGYLLHLAIDVVAHNYFVPYKMVKSFRNKAISHIYWEMRFDLGVSNEAWQRMGELSAYQIEEFDELLERVLRKTLFSFTTNKRIFNSILIAHKIKGMRASLQLYADKSKWKFKEERREHYVKLSWDAAVNFLADPNKARCLIADPAGTRRLAYAKDLRHRIKAMLTYNIIDEAKADQLVQTFHDALESGLYQAELDLPDVTDVL